MTVYIKTTNMGFHVGVSKNGALKGSNVFINEYSRKFQQYQFDQRTHQRYLVCEFFHYDAERETCYFPKFDLDAFCKFLSAYGETYQIENLQGEEGREINIHLLPFVQYKNDKQKNCVEYITNPLSGSVRGVGLQTGTGKTVSVIMGIQKLARRAMITMTSRLEQWVKEICAYTTLDEDDLFVVQGNGALTKLFTRMDKDIKPPIVLMSTRTMRLYLDYGPEYQHLPHPSEMCEKLGIGIIASDEAHENFFTNYMMGMIVNPALFMPITATFTNSDSFAKKIFDQFFPEDVQFEGGDYDRFVNATLYMYTSGGNMIKPFNYTGPQGYSQQKFEAHLLSPRGRKLLDMMIDDAIIPIIKEHYINLAEKGEKFLFLCSSKALCDHLAGVFKRVFKDKTVSVFYSGMPTTILETYDMILSTPGSAGTGRDIKKLRTCFAFENTASEIRNLQFIGRLRGPPQMMNEPHFVTLGCSYILKHQEYQSKRGILYGNRAKVLKYRTI